MPTHHILYLIGFLLSMFPVITLLLFQAGYVRDQATKNVMYTIALVCILFIAILVVIGSQFH